ncbi:OmpH family outer membrane protein [Chryseobacterium daecheongense]|nr:OmpH family outer membrane protein [Chryseobacterium daecheongense]
MRNKKIALTLILFLLFSLSKAQKIGVIDTNVILSKLPDYKEAEARLNAQIATWKSELQSIQSEYEKKKSALENDRVLLVGEELKRREKEVFDLEKNIKTTTSLRFGSTGEINKLKANMVLPFEEQIHNAMETISEKEALGAVIDKRYNNVLYLEKKFDYTERVLDILLHRTPVVEVKETPKRKR